jgi:hypothetical protein
LRGRLLDIEEMLPAVSTLIATLCFDGDVRQIMNNPMDIDFSRREVSLH